MKLLRRILWVGAALVFMPVPARALAPPLLAPPNGLSFAEIKITADEFVVLQNNSGTNIADLSTYWLQDFNNVNPLAAGVSNSAQQLPQVGLANGQTLLLSSAAQPTCGATIAGKLNISLTDGGGFLELVQMGENTSGAVTQTPGDVVSWSSGTSGSIQNVPSGTKDPKASWYRYQNATAYPWQFADVDSINSCQLNVTVPGTTKPQGLLAGLGEASTFPPSTIIGLSGGDTIDNPPQAIPASDLGLLAPQLSELLPNPNGTGTDDTDEFVEMYNPNNSAFDLSGFNIRVGTATTHIYTFPSGTALPAKSFKAFFSDQTGLNMSNSGGQAVLLDPLGTVIGQTDSYGTAKDGQAWAVANGRWYWTTQPTPGDANTINQPAANGASRSSSPKTTNRTGKAKGLNTSTTGSGTSSLSGAQDVSQVTPIHPWTLALVAGLALLYGAYEYRVDIRNRFAQFRADRAARRIVG